MPLLFIIRLCRLVALLACLDVMTSREACASALTLQLLGSKAIENTTPWGAAAAQGNYVYVATATNGLIVHDVSDPKNPRRVGSLPGARGDRLAVEGSLAFLGNGGIQVVDIGDPTQPALRELFLAPEDIYGVTLARNYIFASSRSNLYCMERSIAGEWKILSQTPIAQDGPIFAEGDLVCIQDALTDGITISIYDFSVPAAPVHTATITNGYYSAPVLLRDRRLYTLGPEREIVVYDLSDPRSPRVVRRLPEVDSQQRIERLLAVGDYLYALTANRILIYSLSSDATTPSATAPPTIATFGAIFSSSVAGKRLTITSSSDGAQVPDISDPLRPQALGRLPPNTSIWMSQARIISHTPLAEEAGSKFLIFQIPPQLFWLGGLLRLVRPGKSPLAETSRVSRRGQVDSIFTT